MICEGHIEGANGEVLYVHADDGVRLALTVYTPSPLDTPKYRGAVLMMHGFSQNRNAFLLGAMPRVLADAGMFVAVAELRGHGLSERPQAWTLEDHLRFDLPVFARAVSELCQGVPLHLVGHSMGGMLAFASLAGAHSWASVTGIGAPLELGRGSPLVKLAARLVQPFARFAPDRPIPVHRLLASLAGPLSRAEPQILLRGLQRIVALTNPRVSPPDALRAVLESGDPESLHIFRDLLDAAVRGRALTLGDVELESAVRQAEIPVAAVVGGQDLFAAPSGVRAFLHGHHAGPRRVVSLPEASHVDLSVAEVAARAVLGLLPFLERA